MNSSLAWETDSWVSETLETALLSVLFFKFPGGACALVALSFGARKAPFTSWQVSRQVSLPVLSEICPLLYKTVENRGTSLSDFNGRCLALWRETKMDN